MYTMILALDKNNLVGNTESKFGIPWYYPEDLAFYKRKTINKINVMGRLTFEQIGKALPNRDTLVMSKNRELIIPYVTVISDLEELKKYVEESNKGINQEIMIVGGPKIFQFFFDKVDKIYLTKIDNEYEGNVFYKELNLEKFELKDSQKGNNPDLKFETWIRKKVTSHK